MARGENLTPFEFYTVFTRQLTGALDRWFDTLSKSVGLSGSELKILVFLNAKPSSDTAQWTATQLGISKALVSKVVEQLCSKGYLAQVQDRDDRRCYHLIVQDSAMPLLEKVENEFILFKDVLSRGISEEEFMQYLNVMGRVARNISERLGFDIPGITVGSNADQ